TIDVHSSSNVGLQAAFRIEPNLVARDQILPFPPQMDSVVEPCDIQTIDGATATGDIQTIGARNIHPAKLDFVNRVVALEEAVGNCPWLAEAVDHSRVRQGRQWRERTDHEWPSTRYLKQDRVGCGACRLVGA